MIINYVSLRQEKLIKMVSLVIRVNECANSLNQPRLVLLDIIKINLTGFCAPL